MMEGYLEADNRKVTTGRLIEMKKGNFIDLDQPDNMKLMQLKMRIFICVVLKYIRTLEIVNGLMI